jgi:polyhydroxyalkanoate synthesis regulator phasin
MPEVDEIEKEVRRRSLALEGAMLMLIDGLAARGTISADEAEDMLSILAKSSETSSIRASNSLRTVRRLKQLRRGDGAFTPGA